MAKPAPHLLLQVGKAEQFLGPMKAEDRPAAGVGLQGIGEPGHLAGGLVGEGEGQAMTGKGPGQAIEVLARLGFDAREGMPARLRLDNADGLGIGVEQIVGLAGGERKLTHGDPAPRRNIQLAKVLHDPARLLELAIDLLAGFLFGGHSKAKLEFPDVQPDTS